MRRPPVLDEKRGMKSKSNFLAACLFYDTTSSHVFIGEIYNQIMCYDIRYALSDGQKYVSLGHDESLLIKGDDHWDVSQITYET